MIQPTAQALLLALLWLLAACGTSTTGSAPPTPGPAAPATVAAAPTLPALATVPASVTVAAAPTLPSQPTAAAATAAPATETPPSATTQAATSTTLISYHKSGGIAGISETLTVYTDGTIELRDRAGAAKAQADPSAIAAIQKLLASPELAALQLPAQPPVPDEFVYELRIPGRAKPLVTTDTTDNPPVMRELIDMLEALKAQAR